MNAPATFTADWTQDPRTRRILASFTTDPPQQVTHFETFVQTRDEWREFVGYRVDCLNAIYAAYFERVKPTAVTTDWTAFDAFMAQPTVQTGVSAATHFHIKGN